MRLSGKNSDMLAAAALIALGLYIVGTAARWEWMTPSGPGPGFFPILYGSVMIGLALLLLIRTAIQTRSSEDHEIWQQTGRSFGLLLVFAIAIGLLPVAGYSVVLGALTLFIATILYRRRLSRALVAAILIPAGFHLVFVTLLGVELPAGYLGF